MFRWEICLRLIGPGGAKVPVYRTSDPRLIAAVKGDLRDRLVGGLQNFRVLQPARGWAKAVLAELSWLDALTGEVDDDPHDAD